MGSQSEKHKHSKENKRVKKAGNDAKYWTERTYVHLHRPWDVAVEFEVKLTTQGVNLKQGGK